MITIKSSEEILLMRESGKVTGSILRDLALLIKPGVSTLDINHFVEKTYRENGMYPTFKGYNGFPAAACVSVNEEVIHGIPNKSRRLQEADIVSVDIGGTLKGYVSDAARTYAVGATSDIARRLINITEASFFEGLKFCREGYRVSDISHAVQQKAESAGFSVIRDFVGHGVGRELHEEPQVPNSGKPGHGACITKGMVIAVEPMISIGTYEVETTGQ